MAWAGALVATWVLERSPDADFDRFLGGVPPLLAVGAVGAAGLLALRVLEKEGWLGEPSRGPGVKLPALLALGFGAAILVVDIALGFEPGINIDWPTSVLFYPVMGFVAEIVFHIVPLALVVPAFRRWADASRGAFGVVAPFLLVAPIEAIYQVLGTSSDGSVWLTRYLTLHMLAFGSAALLVLRRHGFGSLMSFRLTYYLIWHVAWGAVRVDLLFPVT